MADSAGDAIQVADQDHTLAKLPAKSLSQDVRRERATLQTSPFNWEPVWNRTHLESYYHNLDRNETRLGDLDSAGPYRIIHVGPTAVHTKVNNIDEGDVDTLWQDRGVEVLMVVVRPDVNRIRARIKSPPGWISLMNLETGYRFAVKADIYIEVYGVADAPELNGRYERDSNEDERGENGYPRFKQVNGDHYIRVSYDMPVWIFTTVRSGPPGNEIRCDSRFYDDPRPVTKDSLPPTYPSAWRSCGLGLTGPMPRLVIGRANEGIIRKFPGRRRLALGIARLDYGYGPAADEIASSGAMGFDLTYRVVPKFNHKEASACQSGELSALMLRNIMGAIERLEQTGAKAIVGDCGFMMSFQSFARQVSSTPIFMSPLVQWPTVASAYAEDDKFLVLTGNEQMFRPAFQVLLKGCGIDLNENRFVIQDCQNVRGLNAVVKGDEVPSAAVEAAVVQTAAGAIERNPDIRGVLLECAELLPYSDELRSALGLPVWDAVTVADFHLSARPDYDRFEVADWEEQLVFEYGKGEGRPKRRPRILGIVSLDYENVRVKSQNVCYASHDYKIIYKSISTLTRYLTSLGKLTKACEKELKETIAWMQDECGCCAITGDCGFMMSYQILVRDHANVPVFMSPLMMCYMILKDLPENLRVLVITADEKLLHDQRSILKEKCRFDFGDPRYVILGGGDLPGLAKLGKKGEMEGDRNSVMAGVVGQVKKNFEEWHSLDIHIGVIVVECAQLLPCSEPLRRETGLPVFDAVSCCDFFMSARRECDRFGIKQWPYVWDRTIEEE